MSTARVAEWMRSQRLKAPTLTQSPIFDRNLEEALDVRRRDHALFILKKNTWQNDQLIDFSSNDTLSLGSSGILRAEFEQELRRYPDAPPGAGSSRIMDGNYDYLQMVEQEIAAFHGAETGLLLGSGFEANLAIFAAIPRPGDAIVYDELVHASTHDGMQQSQVSCKISFKHNKVESFRDALDYVYESQPLVRQGQRCVIIAVESFYSMDGDICPLEELVEVAKEVFPDGNAQFIVDEAHSTGVVGEHGAGLVSELGLQSEIAIRLHTFGKALASSGAIVLGSQTIKLALLNLARPVIFTTAPAFSVVAAARSAYNLLKTGQTEVAQRKVQHLVKHFFALVAKDAVWQRAIGKGIIDLPLISEWDYQPFVSHIVPIWTRQRYSYWMTFHLNQKNICVFPVEYPAVPKGQSRVRLAFHAGNNESQVSDLVTSIGEWASEMIEIEDQNDIKSNLPRAARQVYALMDDQGLNGDWAFEHG